MVKRLKSVLQSGPSPQNPNLLQQPVLHGVFLSHPSLKSHVSTQLPGPQKSSPVPQYPNLLQHPVAHGLSLLQSCACAQIKSERTKAQQSNTARGPRSGDMIERTNGSTRCRVVQGQQGLYDTRRRPPWTGRSHSSYGAIKITPESDERDILQTRLGTLIVWWRRGGDWC
jgi:hypothetical protein